MNFTEFLLLSDLVEEDELLLQAKLLLTMDLQLKTRNKLNGTGLTGAENSSLVHFLKNGDDASYVAKFSLHRQAFEELLNVFGPIYRDLFVAWKPNKPGRPPSFCSDPPRFALGMVLSFYRSSYELNSLSTFCGIPPSTCSTILFQAEIALSAALSNVPAAEIRWPTFEEQAQWATLVNAKSPLITGRWGFIDGKNYPVQKPSADDLQNALYNGWLHRHFVTGTVCFGVDGTIVWAKLNCPGSWNDGEMSRDFQFKLLNPNKCLENHGVIADTAFPVSGVLFGKIVTPLKEGDRERAPEEIRFILQKMSDAITSLRQGAEWGMGAVPKIYRQLCLPLPFNQKRRAIRLKNIHLLYNFRVRRTEISQIRNYFYDLQNPFVQLDNINHIDT